MDVVRVEAMQLKGIQNHIQWWQQGNESIGTSWGMSEPVWDLIDLAWIIIALVCKATTRLQQGNARFLSGWIWPERGIPYPIYVLQASLLWRFIIKKFASLMFFEQGYLHSEDVIEC